MFTQAYAHQCFAYATGPYMDPNTKHKHGGLKRGSFFGFDGGSMLPALGLSWAHLRRQMCPHRTKLRMLRSIWVQAPWTPVGLKLGPSWSLARVRRKLRPSWAEVGGGGGLLLIGDRGIVVASRVFEQEVR